MLRPGLYEQVVNNAMTCELAEIPEARKALVPIDRAEASKVLTQYLSDVVQRGLPETIEKITATFDSYWNSTEFEYYSEDQKERLVKALRAEKYFDAGGETAYTMDVMPYAYQQEILDRLEAERIVRGYTRNLVVAAPALVRQ